MLTEKEIEDTYHIKHKGPERRQTFLRRVLRQVQAGSDDQWEELRPETQRWVHTAAHHHNRSEQIPDFPDTTYAPKPQLVRLIKHTRNAAGILVPSDNKTMGVQTYIKEAVLRSPEASAQYILDKLQQKGYRGSYNSVASIKSGFTHSLKLLLRLGLLDPKKLEEFAGQSDEVTEVTNAAREPATLSERGGQDA